MREDPQELDNVPPTEGAEDIEWDDNEDEETEDDNPTTSPSPPTPSKPRVTTEGTIPPDRCSLIGESNIQEDDFDMAEVDEIGGTVTDSSPAPPTPVRYRSTNPQFVNHIILDNSDGVDTEHYYSDVDPDEEEDEESENDSTVAASPDRVVDETKSTEDKAVNMQQTVGTSGKHTNEYPGIGVPTPSLVDLTGQLTD